MSKHAIAVLGLMLLTNPVWAQASGHAQKCRVVEINPVTNHPMCVDPLGAPLDPLPAGKPCHVKTASDSWTMSNKCEDVPPSK